MRERRGVPVRLRITGWYTMVLLVTMLVVGAFIYVEVERSLQASLEDDLRDRSDLLVSLLDYDIAGNPVLELPTNDRRFAGSFQRLLDRNGRSLVDNSQVWGDVPIEAEELDDARRDRNGQEWSTIRMVGPDTRLLTTAIRPSGEVVGYLQVGDSEEEIDETLNTVLLALGIAVPMAAIICSIAGWLLAARALKPVNEITERAREIADGDLKRRLNLTLPDDEVGRLATTFDEMIGRLDEMWTRQRRFTADASHELRTPLAGLRGQVEVALSQPRESDEYRTTLEALDRQLQRLSRLVEGLLLVARSESGAIPLERENIDVEELLQSVQEQLVPMAEAKGLALRVESSTGTVHGDESLLLQLVLNLAENALRYTPQGEVVLSAMRRGSEIDLVVRDTGPGIPVEDQERIFEPFFRLDAARSNGSGAGLGLAICRWIVEAHGGTLRVTSVPGAGATFVATLPNSSA